MPDFLPRSGTKYEYDYEEPQNGGTVDNFHGRQHGIVQKEVTMHFTFERMEKNGFYLRK